MDLHTLMSIVITLAAMLLIVGTAVVVVRMCVAIATALLDCGVDSRMEMDGEDARQNAIGRWWLRRRERRNAKMEDAA